MRWNKHCVGLGFLLIAFLVPFGLEAKKKKEEPPTNIVNAQNRIIAVSGADIRIFNQKVSKSSTWTLNFLSPLDLEQRKQNLIRSLCKETGADLIIDPQFTYTRRILGGGKLTVTGYPAIYENFKSLTETEVDSIVMGNSFQEGKVMFINKEPID